MTTTATEPSAVRARRYVRAAGRRGRGTAPRRRRAAAARRSAPSRAGSRGPPRRRTRRRPHARRRARASRRRRSRAARRRGRPRRAPCRRARSADGQLAGDDSGTSVITTPGSLSRRSLSWKRRRLPSASRSDRLWNSSGTTTLTKSASLRGTLQTNSSSDSTRPSLGGEELERRPVAASTAASALDRRLGRVPGNMDGAEVARRRSPARTRRPARSSRRSHRRRSGPRPRRRRGGHRGGAGPQPARGAAVVTVDPEEHQDEHRDRDRDEPGALGELGRHDDDEDDAGRERAEQVDRGAAPPAGALACAASSAPSRSARA